MDRNEMRAKAMELLLCEEETLEEREIPAVNAVYYRNTVRGGAALIISPEGEMLYADPFFIDFDAHIRQYLAGERSVFEEE